MDPLVPRQQDSPLKMPLSVAPRASLMVGYSFVIYGYITITRCVDCLACVPHVTHQYRAQDEVDNGDA